MGEQHYDVNTGDVHEHVHVQQVGPYEHRTAVVEDVTAARNQSLSRFTGLIWLLFGLLEAMIALRVVLKLIGANTASAFASFVYSFTDLFLWPFFGLTATPGVGPMVLEIPSLIAMVVYAILAWAIVKILWLLFGATRTRTVTTHDYDRLP